MLTVVSGALAGWLRSRGVQTRGLEMRALIPVSVRGAEHRGALGNQLTVVRGPLPVYIDDPVTRLRFVRHAMDGLKESKQAVGAATLTAMNDLAPPTILAQASRLNFSTRLFNLLVTNVPGPQAPLYVLGRELRDLFPVAFLPSNHALAVAMMSYNGSLDFGLLADYDALPDVAESPRGSTGRSPSCSPPRAAPAWRRSNGRARPATSRSAPTRRSGRSCRPRARARAPGPPRTCVPASGPTAAGAHRVARPGATAGPAGTSGRRI